MQNASKRRRILIVSFSPIYRDARVLKQVAALSSQGDVVTLGLGEAPTGVARHIRIPTGLAVAKPYSRLLAARLFRVAYWRQKGVRWARDAVRGERFDLVVANDLDSVPVAAAIAPRRVIHADLHEYSPRMREERPGWHRTFRPYYEWIARRYAARVASITTVSRGLAEAYESLTGREIGLVANAAPYVTASVRPTSIPIRLVHSGGAIEHRGIEQLVDAVEASSADVTLDLYLVPNSEGVMRHVTNAARRDARITLHPPVSYNHLMPTLQGYDVGAHFLMPVNFNHENALPNKIFDYVQARLALVVGPTREMAQLVTDRRLGTVSATFQPDDIRQAIDSLTRESVDRAKRAADAAAHDLSAEAMTDEWLTAWRQILERAQ